ncbi:hypothetical protein CDL15_Pgr005152 [Punica granatum]|uniref:Uncharacterized protein n=1 Tax=Punica granatum TaxID=22663 RepID=A0A218WRH8_PUNGR|nr:hypothetical protein CDL15_Pgr005152 [Punica granatum]
MKFQLLRCHSLKFQIHFNKSIPFLVCLALAESPSIYATLDPLRRRPRYVGHSYGSAHLQETEHENGQEMPMSFHFARSPFNGLRRIKSFTLYFGNSSVEPVATSPLTTDSNHHLEKPIDVIFLRRRMRRRLGEDSEG